MDGLIKVIIVASILGSGLITGLLFAFSNFVMRALADLPSDEGMFAMQRINEKIINPVFMMFFLGTPILCSVILFTSGQNINESGSFYLFIGALAYLIGPFGITMLFNVPLNNLLARTVVSDADKIWPVYQKRWQMWNHIRTYIGVVSIVFMTLGFGGV
ncbi:MAG: anthrone oxygenase family protein [Pseudomonadota bacterium]|nr:anthrone oxygenase family protein [Pseudomonadota bacterium]